jgi:hypothetical protein
VLLQVEEKFQCLVMKLIDNKFILSLGISVIERLMVKLREKVVSTWELSAIVMPFMMRSFYGRDA